ncbi:MAG: DHH family phosphoesterase [Armatimonadota bacterium]
MSPSKSDLEAVRQLIESAESISIAAHVRPDADSIGSSLALARGLRLLGKRVVVLSDGGVPETCEYLPEADTVLTATDERGFDIGIICDSDGLDRIGASREAIESSKSYLVIDHHASERKLDSAKETIYLTDTLAAATAEVVFHLLHDCNIMPDLNIARQLMAGLVGDTGGFRFSNVTSETLEIASRLAMDGATPGEAAREIYENRSLVNARLLGVVLAGFEVSDDGKIVWSRITQQDFKKYNATDADTESIVNQLRGIKGAKAAVLFREVEPGVIQISLRSRDGVDVNRVAGKFGGGGHASAAGCTIRKSLKEAEESVLAEVRACMES